MITLTGYSPVYNYFLPMPTGVLPIVLNFNSNFELKENICQDFNMKIFYILSKWRNER